jgi:hypothetical protein
MAHAHYRMKGHCKLCAQIMFIGVCPHGMAEYVGPEGKTMEELCEEFRTKPLDPEIAEAMRQVIADIERQKNAPKPEPPKFPRWTVLYNIVSKENDRWVGTAWEFFDDERDAQKCYDRQIREGNCPTKRPYYDKCDRPHLGAAHQFWLEQEEKGVGHEQQRSPYH